MREGLSWEGHIGSYSVTGLPPVAQMVKNPPAMWETWVQSLGWEVPGRGNGLPTPVFWPGEFRGQRSLAGYRP